MLDPLDGERKAYDEIYSAKREIFSKSQALSWSGQSRGANPAALWTWRWGRAESVGTCLTGMDSSGFDISPLAIDEARNQAKAGLCGAVGWEHAGRCTQW
jgi:hypothetical protein